MKNAWLVLGVSCAAACGGNSVEKIAPDPVTTSSDDAGADGLALKSTITIGPIPVARGEEKTVCVTERLTNTETLNVSKIDAVLTQGSHHLVLYRSTDTVESLTPTPCQPFEGIVSGTVPMYVVQSAAETLTFPAGVAIQLDPKQMIRIEAHYLNATTKDLQGTGTVRLYGYPSADAITQRADLFFYGTSDITLAPQSMGTAGPMYHRPPVGMNVFAITTHQHRLGVDATVQISSGKATEGQVVYDNTNWDNPPLTEWDPPRVMGATDGFRLTCKYNNVTDDTVTFGTSATDEMCFVYGYFYPATSLDLYICGLFGKNPC